MRISVTFETALEVACRAADRAKRLVSESKGELQSRIKNDGSPVTALDKSIELAIRAEIGETFPDHSIRGEEFPDKSASAIYKWVIDPIDGTVAMLNRIPTFATLIALCEDGMPVVSLVELHALGERYTAVKGNGARCGSTRLTVSDSFEWDRSIVCHGDRYTFASSGYAGLFDAVANRVRFFRSYTDAFGHTLVAKGASALMVDSAMEPWDLAAPMLLVQEAGGRVSLYRDRNQSCRFLGICGNWGAVEAIDEIAASLEMWPEPPGEVRLT